MTPLLGRTILITRPAHQIAELAIPLKALGADVIAIPATEILPPENEVALREALENLSDYDWLILTSANGVRAIARYTREIPIKVAVVGPSTAKVLKDLFGRGPDATPKTYLAEEIANAIGEVEGKWFLLPRADLAHPELPNALRSSGGIVEEVVAYRIARAEAPNLEGNRRPDYVLLTSSESARATHALLNQKGTEDWLHKAKLVCIGPQTASTVRELGYQEAIVAKEFTMNGLIEALVDEVRHA